MTPEQWNDINAALLAYWTARDEASIAQQARGVIDPGGRAGVTSGGHLDRIAQLLARICRAAGAPDDQIYYKAPKDESNKRPSMKKGRTLPGYYRPTKEWDLVVYADEAPIVAVELKSQNGPSYGNNANNRAEEAIGNAADMQRAINKKLFSIKPWMGYVFVIEDDERSRFTGGSKKQAFLDVDQIFTTWSYATRIQELSARLVTDKLYDGAWPIATSRPTCPDAKKSEKERAKKKDCAQRWAKIEPCNHEFGWRELDPDDQGYSRFIRGMTAKIAQHYPDAKTSGDISVNG